MNYGEEWFDITRVGSLYEEQTDVHSSRKRHRRVSKDATGENMAVGEWMPGLAPDNPSRQT